MNHLPKQFYPLLLRLRNHGRPYWRLQGKTLRCRCFFSNVNEQTKLIRNNELNDRSSLTTFVRTEADDIMKNIILPINEAHRGPLEETFDQQTPLPFVFLLGNHSSGKSSFINHVLARRVQDTGVAPTDDGFTIIVPGPKDIDQAGPSVVGDPDMGFNGLRTFGPNLIHHLQLKVRSGLSVNDIMLIDSPGMIDSPMDSIYYRNNNKNKNNNQDLYSNSRQQQIDERGYDFQGVTRWFAERADVILLFFDPDKPGTTGETLNVLTNSLAGMDHKLHIVLNKVDQFKKIHDFARAYGSLCWNVSKVISRKDLPRIYTMYTPVTLDNGSSGSVLKHSGNGRCPEPDGEKGIDLTWSSALKDLEDTRMDVIGEVCRAPERRIDNMITHIYDSSRLLRMYLVLSEAVRLDYNLARRRTIVNSVAVGVTGCSVSLAALYLAPAVWTFAAVLSISSIAGASGVYLFGNHRLSGQAKKMCEVSFLDRLFSRVYAREIADNDQFVHSLWRRVRPQVISALETIGPDNMKRVTASELSQLDSIIEEQVPDLRRAAAPTIHKI